MLLENNRHASVDVLDLGNGWRGDNGAAGDAEIVIVRPYAGEAEWCTISHL